MRISLILSSGQREVKVIFPHHSPVLYSTNSPLLQLNVTIVTGVKKLVTLSGHVTLTRIWYRTFINNVAYWIRGSSVDTASRLRAGHQSNHVKFSTRTINFSRLQMIQTDFWAQEASWSSCTECLSSPEHKGEHWPSPAQISKWVEPYLHSLIRL